MIVRGSLADRVVHFGWRVRGRFQRSPFAVLYRLKRIERQQRVWNTMAWLEGEPVSDRTLVSVITPTFHRPERLAEAIGSVLAQRHQRWEMVVVDDGSATARPVVTAIGDPRVRVIDADHGGPCHARNVGLAEARGDIIVYLDDDNWLDPGWLHAVVWAFDNRPEAEVLYGARLVDDEDRVHDRPGPGWPWLQFEPFDRRRLEHGNFTDMGAIAHRAGIEGARFDERFIEGGDWDFLLTLTESRVPLELPAIALRYRSDGADRLTGVQPGDIDVILEKWARRRATRPGR